jgi:hypothetical protein
VYCVIKKNVTTRIGIIVAVRSAMVKRKTIIRMSMMTTVHGGLRESRVQMDVVTSATMSASKEQRRLRKDVMM